MSDQSPQIWYSLVSYKPIGQFEELEVINETESFLIYIDRGRKRREAKRSMWRRWFPSKREALQDALRARKVRLQTLIEDAKDEEKRVMELEEALK